ncbi:uncharacterized protein PV07_00074 [Cladophialophora immunda]|uniref:Uncharacterized protein n=1 Tax=Cladophialophora immunda TaxID=569365 RepID=A0A0D2CTF8_9EURO|nr:uncharacterized protein PV07_00074 [Cladophialophora immunda]KIW33205.1 hypothetical protein PV07_00074 [Cladophialophora immunda]
MSHWMQAKTQTHPSSRSQRTSDTPMASFQSSHSPDSAGNGGGFSRHLPGMRSRSSENSRLLFPRKSRSGMMISSLWKDVLAPSCFETLGKRAEALKVQLCINTVSWPPLSQWYMLTKELCFCPVPVLLGRDYLGLSFALFHPST